MYAGLHTRSTWKWVIKRSQVSTTVSFGVINKKKLLSSFGKYLYPDTLKVSRVILLKGFAMSLSLSH